MRPIDADAVIKNLSGISGGRNRFERGIEAGLSNAILRIENAPTLTLDDLRPKGRWEDKYDGKYANQVYRCSACGVRAMNVDNKAWFLPNFCPHCGADVRGGGEDG